MNKKKTCRFLMIALILCSLVAGMVPATVSAAKKTGWVEETNGYCYYVKGKKVKNKLKKIKGKTYYLGSDGVRKTGWYTVKTKSKGKTVYKAMKFNAKGAYTGKSQSVNAKMIKKADSVIKSQKIGTGVTTAEQKEAALEKLFNYTKKYAYGRVMGLNSRSFNKGKITDSAYKMMSKKKGNCYYYASAFAVLAKRATGLPVRVCWGTSTVFNEKRAQEHAWTEVKLADGKWHVYDPNAARFSTRKDIGTYAQEASSVKSAYKASKKCEVIL